MQNIKTLTLNFPLPEKVTLIESEAKELLMLKLVEEGIMSQSEAAGALGISRYDLLQKMGEHQVPIMRYSKEDLEKEENVILRLKKKRQQQKGTEN